MRIPTRLVTILFTLPALAQVQTEVPPIVPGAKPATVEHIKIHGGALEGNLEGNAAERDVLVFLPPSYAGEKNRRYPAPSSGRRRFTFRRRLKVPSRKARKT